MLGAEKQIIEAYVQTGIVRIVFWPILDHGAASLNSHAAAECAGRQDPEAFWRVHDIFFANQGELWQAGTDYYVNTAESVGLDRSMFEDCFDSGEAHAVVQELDNARRGEGIFSRPTFFINDQLLIGVHSFEVYAEYIENALAQ